MFRLLVPVVALSAFVATACKTSDGEGAGSETKDVVTQSGLVTKHYYAVGEEARRAICPFGIDSEDPETYRAQCEVSKTLPLGEFTENLEKAYMTRFKGGQPLSDDENQIGGLMVQSLAEPNVLKVKAGQPASDQSDVIVARFAQVFEEAFGFNGGTVDNGGDNGGNSGGGNGGGNGGGGNGGVTIGDNGSQILTASFVAPLGVSATPLIVSQNPVTTNAVSVQLLGCQGQVIGMAIAEGPGQLVLAMGAAGPGVFATISGLPRKMAMIQLTINAAGGFCQVKVTSLGANGGGGGNVDTGPLGPETQIGVIQYNGGFIPQLVAPLNPPRLVKQFRVAVPAGCQAEVVKGGILTTQQVAPTTLLDPASHTYRVNNGAGTIASGVSVSLNGPLGFCQIPVFVR